MARWNPAQRFRVRALWESARMAFGSVRDNTLRSVLTCLGIVIGVATVIGMLGVVAGINDMISSQLGFLGASSFIVQKYPAVRMGRPSSEIRNRPNLTLEDARAIQASCPSVERVAPRVLFRAQQARSGGNKTDPNVLLVGATSSYVSVAGASVEHGRNITPLDETGSSEIALVGADVVDRVFPYGDSAGSKGQSSFTGKVLGCP